MAIVRPTTKAYLQAQEYIADLKNRKEWIESLQQSQDSKFWALLKKYLSFVVEANTGKIDSALEETSTVSDPGTELSLIKFNAGYRKCAKDVISFVDDPSRQVEAISKKIKEIQEKLKQMKDGEIYE